MEDTQGRLLERLVIATEAIAAALGGSRVKRTRTVRAAERIDFDAAIKALITKHPDANNKRLSSMLGVHPSTVSRSIGRIRAELGIERPRGFKAADGAIEAWGSTNE